MLLIRLFAILILSTFWANYVLLKPRVYTPTLKKHQVVRDLKKFENHCVRASRHAFRAILYQLHCKIVRLPSLFSSFLDFSDCAAFVGEYAYVDTFTKSYFRHSSSVVRLENGTSALLMLIAHLTSQVSIMGRTALIYSTKQIPVGAFANIKGLLCMWNFVNFYDPRLTTGLWLRVSDASAVESSQKLHHGSRPGLNWCEALG